MSRPEMVVEEAEVDLDSPAEVEAAGDDTQHTVESVPSRQSVQTEMTHAETTTGSNIVTARDEDIQREPPRDEVDTADDKNAAQPVTAQKSGAPGTPEPISHIEEDVAEVVADKNKGAASTIDGATESGVIAVKKSVKSSSPTKSQSPTEDADRPATVAIASEHEILASDFGVAPDDTKLKAATAKPKDRDITSSGDRRELHELKDVELIHRAQGASGDGRDAEHAFATIVNRHRDDMRAAALKIVGSNAAEDAVSEAFLNFYNRLPKYKTQGEASVGPYLITAARRHAINHLRSEGRVEDGHARNRLIDRREVTSDLMDRHSPAAESPEDVVIAEASERELMELLNSSVGPKRAEMLRLHYVEGYSQEETVQMLGIDPGKQVSNKFLHTRQTAAAAIIRNRAAQDITEENQAPIEAPEPNKSIQNSDGARDLERPEVTDADRDNMLENRNKLEAEGYVGQMMSDIYTLALRVAPELARVKIVPTNTDETPGLAFTGGKTTHHELTGESGPTVELVTGDGILHYERLMQTRPASIALCADKAGIPIEDFTPEDLAKYIAAHELGHAFLFMAQPNYEAVKARRQQELQSLPVPGMDPSRLANSLNTDDGRQWYADNLEIIQGMGINSPEELLRRQEAAYHSLPSEDNPDQFAASILKWQKKLIYEDVKVDDKAESEKASVAKAADGVETGADWQYKWEDISSDPHLVQALIATYAFEVTDNNYDRDFLLKNLLSLDLGNGQDITRVTDDYEYNRSGVGSHPKKINPGMKRIVASGADIMGFLNEMGGPEYEAIRGRADILREYGKFEPAIKVLLAEVADPTEGAMHTSYWDMGSNSHVYIIEHDKEKYAVRIPKNNNNTGLISTERSIDYHLAGAILGTGVRHMEQIVAASYTDGVTVAKIMPGETFDRLSTDEIGLVTEEHVGELIETLKTAHERGIEIDTYLSNILFDPTPDNGLEIVDYGSLNVGGFSMRTQDLGDIVSTIVADIYTLVTDKIKAAGGTTAEDYARNTAVCKAYLGLLTKFRNQIDSKLTGANRKDAMKAVDYRITLLQADAAKNFGRQTNILRQNVLERAV